MPIAGGLLYKDKLGTRRGFQRIKIKTGTGPQAQIQAKGRGAGLGMQSLLASFPLTAQLINRDTGACWQSAFPSAKTNTADKVTAALP